MRFDERSPYEKNFIYAYQAVPTLRVSYITQDIYVCSFLLCDHLPRKNIESFTPTYSYRFDMAYEELSSVCLTLQSHSQSERQQIASEVRSLFLFGCARSPRLTPSYENYLHRAFPAPQLDPLRCGQAPFAQCDIPYMTLIDTLDTLHVLELDDLFVDAIRLLEWE